MKRIFTFFTFPILALFFTLSARAQTWPTTAPYSTNCNGCHSGANAFGTGITFPTTSLGFHHGGWDALFTRMEGYSASVQEANRATIVGFLNSNRPLASPSTLPSGTVGTAYSQSMSANGGTAPFTGWTMSGVPGLSISSGGAISGTPTTAGTFTITFSATDSSGVNSAPASLNTASFPASITINPAPPLSVTGPASLSSGTVGTAYGPVTFTATGGTGTGYTWSLISGSLPSNLSISAGGSLSGTPQAGTAGTYNNLQFQVKDSANNTATTTLSLTIANPALQVTGPGSLTSGTVGVAYGPVTFTATGGTGTGYTWSLIQGSLPANVSISAGGVLSGTPQAGTAGTYSNIKFQVKDSANNTASSVTLSLTIGNPTLQVTGPVSLSSGTVGVAYGPVTFTASGGTGTGYTWSLISGTLPANLSISPGGALSGTPQAGTVGTYNNLQFQVKDSANNTATTAAMSLTIFNPGLQVTSPTSLSGGTVGAAYGPVTFTATGGTGTGYVWSLIGGTLPANLSISSGGVLSGTPQAGTAGTYNNLQFQVKDSANNTAVSVTMSLTIANPTLQITSPASLPAGVVLTAYGPITFTATGGTGTGYTWSLIGGTLPNNISFSAAGVLNGTPQAGTAATYNPQFQVKDSANTTANVTLQLIINNTPPPSITGPATLTNGTVSVAYTPVTFTASGGSGSGYTWTATNLPAGMSISAGGILSGTPQAGSNGSYNPQVTVKDSANSSSTVILSLIVVAGAPGPPAITSMSPNPVPALNANQTVTINGSGFVSGAGLKVHLVTGATSSDVSGAQLTFLSSTQLTISVNVGTSVANWTAQVINPDAQGSNVFAFTVASQSATAVNLPQIAFGGDPASAGNWYTAIYFSNTTGASQTFTVSFLTNGGTALSVPLLGVGSVTSQQVTLAAGQTQILELTTNSTTLTEGWAEAALPSGVTGYGVYRQVVNGRQPQEAIVPMTPETAQTANFPFDDINFFTTFSVLNPTNQSVQVTVSISDSNGAAQGSVPVLLAARSKQTFVLRNLLGGAAGKRGWATFTVSSGAVSVIAFRFGGQAFTSIPVSFGALPAVTLAVPQYAFGGDQTNGVWYTAFYFSNTTGSAAAPFTVKFMTDTGAPQNTPIIGIGAVTQQTVSLAAGATQTLEVFSAGPLTQGWVEVPLPAGVTGYAVYRQSVTGRTDQEAVLPFASEANQTADFAFDDVNFTTAFAFLNPTNQAETLTVTAHAADGTVIATVQLPAPARSKVSNVLRNQAGLAGVAGKRGYITVSSSTGAVSAIAFRFGGIAFTSITINSH